MSDTRDELYDPDDPSTWPAHARRAHDLAVRASAGHPYECGAPCLLCAAEEAAQAAADVLDALRPGDDLGDLWIGVPDPATTDKVGA